MEGKKKKLLIPNGPAFCFGDISLRMLITYPKLALEHIAKRKHFLRKQKLFEKKKKKEKKINLIF